jgi:hypothetical protein
VLCGGSGVKVEDAVESRDEKESASGLEKQSKIHLL